MVAEVLSFDSSFLLLAFGLILIIPDFSSSKTVSEVLSFDSSFHSSRLLFGNNFYNQT